MADDTDQPGFKIQGIFFPHVGFDDWLLPDCRLARLVTGYNETDLLRGKASPLLVNVAFAAVAFHRGRPAVTISDVADLFDTIPPDTIELVGFKDQAGTDADPPAESGSAHSESSEPTPAADPGT